MTQQKIDHELQKSWLEAADAGDIPTLERMLATNPELINSRYQGPKASSALHLSVWKNNSQLAAFLLENGADTEIRDEAGLTALHVDILRICMERMRHVPLLRSQCVHSNSSMTSFQRKHAMYRAKLNEVDTCVLEILLKFGAEVNTVSQIGGSALHLAVNDGLTKVVRLLLNHGADVDSKDNDGKSAFEIAAERAHVDIVRLLVNAKNKLLQDEGNHVLGCAVSQDNVMTVKAIWELMDEFKMQQKDQLGGSLCLHAASCGSKDTMQMLLEQGVSVNYQNETGVSAIHAATSNGQVLIMELLIEKGANVNIISTIGMAPLHVAITKNLFSEMDVLIRAGAYINGLDRESRTPLLYAATSFSSNEMMNRLICHGGHFSFPTERLRDDILPILAQWLVQLGDAKQTAYLIEQLMKTIHRNEQIEEIFQQIIFFLTWTLYHEETLTLVLLVTMSRHSCRIRALGIIKEWMLSVEKKENSLETTRLLDRLVVDFETR